MNEAKEDILVGTIIFVLDLVLFYYLWQNNLLLTISLSMVSILVLLKWTNKEEKILYFTAFILVPIYDIVLVPTGIWSYGNPTIFGIPIWIPLVYGILTVVAIKISKSINQIYSK